MDETLTKEEFAEIREQPALIQLYSWDVIVATIDARDAEIARLTGERDALQAEVARLRERLELGFVYKDDGTGKLVRVEDPTHTGPDGIECRDETIRILDQNVDTLRRVRADLEAEVARLKAMPGAVPDGWVLLPRKRTPAMLHSAAAGLLQGDGPWDSLIAAAPPPPSTYTHAQVMALVEAARAMFSIQRDLMANDRSAIDGIEAALSPFTSPGTDAAQYFQPTHRHRKGGKYRVLTRGAMEADYPATPVVVYDDAKGRVFVRPAVEFDDGRFTAITATGQEES